MSNIPAELKYVASHEWLRLEEDGTVAADEGTFAGEHGFVDFGSEVVAEFFKSRDIGTSPVSGCSIHISYKSQISSSLRFMVRDKCSSSFEK